MSSLVADYGSGSSSSESESTDDKLEEEKIEKRPLPRPTFSSQGKISSSVTPDTTLTTNVRASVFTNPFANAENAKQAALEKHVKMVATTTTATNINGKKVCWMYRKGRCRFGHKCKMAHDSDLVQNTDKSVELESSKTQTNVPDTSDASNTIQGNSNVPSPAVKSKKRKKTRPGLSQTLIPSKKVMSFYHKTKDT